MARPASKPNVRGLAVLAVLTVIAVVAAIFAVVNDVESVRSDLEPQPMFPELEDQVNDVERIRYTAGRGLSGTQTITLERNAEGLWTVRERFGYPAKLDLVRKTVIGLSALELVEPRTADPEWHRNIGVLEPEKLGTGVRVELFGEGDEPLAALIAGETVGEGDGADGRGSIYVRRDGEDQTYVARGRFSLQTDLSEWLEGNLLSLERDEIARVVLRPREGDEVVLAREGTAESDFTIENLPQGRVPRGAAVVNGTATALANFRFEDVLPAGELNFEGASMASVETLDGLIVDLQMTGAANALWATLEASAPEGSEAAKAEAEAVNERAGGWAYKLPQGLAGQLLQPMSVLTREEAELVDG